MSPNAQTFADRLLNEDTRWGYDIPGPNSVIIGDNYVTGTLHSYETGDEVGAPRFSGETDQEIRDQAKAWFDANGGKERWPQGLELRLRP